MVMDENNITIWSALSHWIDTIWKQIISLNLNRFFHGDYEFIS